jgi:hypothetical protein
MARPNHCCWFAFYENCRFRWKSDGVIPNRQISRCLAPVTRKLVLATNGADAYSQGIAFLQDVDHSQSPRRTNNLSLGRLFNKSNKGCIRRANILLRQVTASYASGLSSEELSDTQT